MSFENDFLISYAHIDDQSLLEGQPGWASTFHRILEIRIAQLLGEKPRIQSEWCTRKLCRASARSGGVQVADTARIFKVVKTPIPRERHPEPLQPLLGYELYVTDPQTGRPRELFHFFDPEAERQFLTRLDEPAWDICQLLQFLRENGGAAPAHSAAPRATVYLAETSFDLREEREAIRRDLLRNGYEVLPDRPLPLVADDLEAFVREQVERCEIPLDDLRRHIHLKLAPQEPRTKRMVAPVGGVARIYLICDRNDLEAVRPVEDFLFDQGFEVLPTLFDEDEAQARLDHQESLGTCDAVLLFQGQASEMWLQRKPFEPSEDHLRLR